MMRLILANIRQLCGRWSAWIAVGGLVAAAMLSYDAVLDAGSTGVWLAYIALLPMLLLLRLGVLRRARRAEGWSAEERLRDPSGIRAPLAEASGTAVLCAVLLLLAGLFPTLGLIEFPQSERSLHPVRATAIEDGWLLRFAAPAPPDSALFLTFTYEALPAEDGITLTDLRGQTVAAHVGEVLRWPIADADLRTGSVELTAAAPALATDAGMQLVAPIARLEVPRPGAGRVGGLLFGLFLYFLPLIALTLAAERFLRIDGVLAAVTVLMLGALAAYRPVLDYAQPGGVVGVVVKAVLLLKAALPDVSALYAVGHQFELRAGTGAASATLAWLLMGAVALYFACRRRRPR